MVASTNDCTASRPMASSLADAGGQNARVAILQPAASLRQDAMRSRKRSRVTLHTGSANDGLHQFLERSARIGRLIVGSKKLHHRFPADGMFGDDLEREQRGCRQNHAG